MNIKVEDNLAEDAPFNQLVWADDTPVCTSEFYLIGHNMRLCYKPNDRYGFVACVVDFVSCSMADDENKSIWSCDDLCVTPILHAIAMFDGIRHLEMPYVNYPDTPNFPQIFTLLRELESQYCRSAP